MYQHSNENHSFNSIKDLLLVLAIVLFIVFMRRITTLFSSIPFGGILNLALLLALVAACYWIYRQRLCTYRYTIFFEQPPEGELDEYGEQATQPYPLGTILFDRMVSSKGKLYEGVNAHDFVALIPPGKKYEEKISFFNYAKLTVYPIKTAHTLVFRRKGKLYGIYFSPKPEMIECMHKCPLLDLSSYDSQMAADAE